MSGDELRGARETRGLTRGAMAVLIGVASESTVYRWETGRRRIDERTALAIRAAMEDYDVQRTAPPAAGTSTPGVAPGEITSPTPSEGVPGPAPRLAAGSSLMEGRRR